MIDPDPLPDLKLSPPAAERPLFAGFPRRLGAFAIDGILIYAVAYGLDWSARAALLTLNPMLPWLGHLAAFAYFAAAQGPVGHGRTLGKSILDIRVVGENGQSVGWGASLKRSLLQQCAFLPLIDPVIYGLIFPAPIRYDMWIAIQLIQVLALTLVVTLAFGIGIHPRKRGWHDLLGGTYVINEPSAYKFQQEMAAEPDLVTQRKIVMIPKLMVIFWVIGSIILLLKPIKMAADPELRRQAREAEALETAHPIRPYEITIIQRPDKAMRQEFLKAVQAYRQAALDRHEDAPTTETLRRRILSDGESILVRCDRGTGAFAPADLEDPRLREGIEAIRGDLWAAWTARREDSDTTATLPPALRFHALLFEPLQLLFHNETKLRGMVTGPADPGAGPLSFEEYVPPPTLAPPGAPRRQSEDGQAPTTSTATLLPSTEKPTTSTATVNPDARSTNP